LCFRLCLFLGGFFCFVFVFFVGWVVFVLGVFFWFVLGCLFVYFCWVATCYAPMRAWFGAVFGVLLVCKLVEVLVFCSIRLKTCVIHGSLKVVFGPLFGYWCWVVVCVIHKTKDLGSFLWRTGAFSFNLCSRVLGPMEFLSGVSSSFVFGGRFGPTSSWLLVLSVG